MDTKTIVGIFITTVIVAVMFLSCDLLKEHDNGSQIVFSKLSLIVLKNQISMIHQQNFLKLRKH